MPLIRLLAGLLVGCALATSANAGDAAAIKAVQDQVQSLSDSIPGMIKKQGDASAASLAQQAKETNASLGKLQAKIDNQFASVHKDTQKQFADMNKKIADVQSQLVKQINALQKQINSIKPGK